MIIAENSFRMGYIVGLMQWGTGGGPLGVLSGPGDVLAWDGSSYVAKQRTVNRLLFSNQVCVSTTYEDIVGLLCTINRIGHFEFEYWIRYQTSAVGEGIGLQLAYSGTAATCNYAIDMFTDPATRAPLITASAFGTGLAPQAAGPGAVDAIARISGSFKADTVGVLSAQMRAETGGANSASAMVSSWANVVERSA
jgi:hypothetical protein